MSRPRSVPPTGEEGAPAAMLPDAPWRDEPGTRAVIAALTAAGGAPRFVGGCVRDGLLGRPVTDVDLATRLRPEAVMAALQAAGIRVVPTGIDHGTVTAIADGRPFEITTLRVDVETHGRRARVAFTDDWRADAARRDFTMNALSADPDGTIHDYFGGAADARAGRVRFVGVPEQRIEEDVLRLLRLFRFHAHYGRGPLDPAALAAAAAFAPRLSGLPGERIGSEIMKLLSAADPVPAWRAMIDTGVSVQILGACGDIDRLAALVRVEPAPDPVRRLAALAGGCDAAALADRLRLSNAEAARLEFLLAPPPAALESPTPAALPEALYRHGRGRTVDALLLAAARPGADAVVDLARRAEEAPVPEFPLRGRDLLALGVTPGPRVGALLSAVERWWIDGGLSAGREACLEEVRRLAAQGQ